MLTGPGSTGWATSTAWIPAAVNNGMTADRHHLNLDRSRNLLSLAVRRPGGQPVALGVREAEPVPERQPALDGAASSTAIFSPHSAPFGERRRGSERVLSRHDHIACTACFNHRIIAVDMSQLLLGRFAEMIPFGIARCPPRTEALVKHDADGRPADC